ncbi:hypothetical protein KKF11_01065, partial [Patescibacteria group bacterium]|nr:hypothetical protein [Patescibacteria group bacterium]
GINSRNGRRYGRMIVLRTEDSSFPRGREIYVDGRALLEAGLSSGEIENPLGRRFYFLPRKNQQKRGLFYAGYLKPENSGESMAT